MIRINLLPHREEKRKARRQQFYALAGLVSLLASLIVFLGYTVMAGYISLQEETNDYLKKEIQVLDAQIDQIKGLREKTQAMLARKKIIESLQRDRAEAVRLLAELTAQVPEGVYLKTVKQESAVVTITGYAQSNARVSTLMRNIEASPWMEKPNLIEIKAADVGRRRLSEFSMTFQMSRAEADSPATAQKDKK